MTDQFSPGSWQDNIAKCLLDNFEEIAEEAEKLEPDQPLALQAWNSLEDSLDKELGVKNRSREFVLGCVVGMIGRLGEDTLAGIAHNRKKITPESKAAFRRICKFLEVPDKDASLSKFYGWLEEAAQEFNTIYRKTLRFSEEAPPSEIDFAEGVLVARRTGLLNHQMLPAFGTDRSPLHMMLSVIGAAAKLGGITEIVIDPEKFAHFVGI